ncbi:MAG TPA: hypothetical protein VF813_08585 [Anaerolineaceae bacterium]
MKWLRIASYLGLAAVLALTGCSILSPQPLSARDLSKVVLKSSEVSPGFTGSGSSSGMMVESMKSMAQSAHIAASYEINYSVPNNSSAGMYISDILVFGSEAEANQVYNLWIKESAASGFSAPGSPMETIGDESTTQLLVRQNTSTGADYNKGAGVLWRYKEALGFLYQEGASNTPVDLAHFMSLAKTVQGRLAG